MHKVSTTLFLYDLSNIQIQRKLGCKYWYEVRKAENVFLDKKRNKRAHFCLCFCDVIDLQTSILREHTR